jgi:hypothetical protein
MHWVLCVSTVRLYEHSLVSRWLLVGHKQVAVAVDTLTQKLSVGEGVGRTCLANVCATLTSGESPGHRRLSRRMCARTEWHRRGEQRGAMQFYKRVCTVGRDGKGHVLESASRVDGSQWHRREWGEVITSRGGNFVATGRVNHCCCCCCCRCFAATRACRFFMRCRSLHVGFTSRSRSSGGW